MTTVHWGQKHICPSGPITFFSFLDGYCVGDVRSRVLLRVIGNIIRHFFVDSSAQKARFGKVGVWGNSGSEHLFPEEAPKSEKNRLFMSKIINPRFLIFCSYLHKKMSDDALAPSGPVNFGGLR